MSQRGDEERRIQGGGDGTDGFDGWVLDATMGGPDFVFIPYQGELGSGTEVYYTGLNLVGAPLGECHAVIHEDGQEAAEAFMERYRAEIEKVFAPTPESAVANESPTPEEPA